MPNIKCNIPQRTCIACRKVMPKCELSRLVKTTGGEIRLDRSGRLPGRGAYLCPQCLREGIMTKNLKYALKTMVTESDIARLTKSFTEQGK